MTMIKKYKILAKFVKDMSSETPDIDTYLFVKDNIKNYSLHIGIKSKVLKQKIIQKLTGHKLQSNSLQPININKTSNCCGKCQ